MGLLFTEDLAVLEGHVRADDAEPLLQWLLSQASPQLHLAHAEHVHAAVLQVLLAFRPPVVAAPNDPWLVQALQDRTKDREKNS
jgi:hypothetical protein